MLFIGSGSKFDSNLATRGGNILVLSNGITTNKGVVHEILNEIIKKRKLVSPEYRIANGINYYSNKYFYQGIYSAVYRISYNGYTEDTYPIDYGGIK